MKGQLQMAKYLERAANDIADEAAQAYEAHTISLDQLISSSNRVMALLERADRIVSGTGRVVAAIKDL